MRGSQVRLTARSAHTERIDPTGRLGLDRLGKFCRGASVLAIAAICAGYGCFDPSFEGVRCGDNGECPPGLSCDLTVRICRAEGPSDRPDAGAPVDVFFGTRCVLFEPNDRIDQAVPVANTGFPGRAIDASLCLATGRDFYDVLAPRDRAIVIDLHYVGTVELGMQLHDPPDTVVKEGIGHSGGIRMTFSSTDLVGGKRYVIEIYSARGEPAGESDYRLEAISGAE